MTSLVTERFDTAGGERVVRALDAAAERVAEVLGGRTVWCAAAIDTAGGPAEQLRARLDAAGPGVIATSLMVPEMSDQPDSQAAEPAVWSGVRCDDVVVAHDARTALLAQVVRDQGAHAVWRLRAGVASPATARAALDLLGRFHACVDAYLLSWTERGAHGGLIERVIAAMPAAGIVAAKEFSLGVSGDDPRRLAWRMAVAEVIRTDRDEAVGGTLHARPTVAAR
jgi:hypothetical protein